MYVFCPHINCVSTYFGQFLCYPKCTFSPPHMVRSCQSLRRCVFLLLGSSRPLDVDLVLPLLSLLSLFYFFPLLCWWYKWRKCPSPEGHWQPTRHKLLSACKGLLQWQGFYLLYLSQMLWLSLMLHLKSFVWSWLKAFGKCKPEAKRRWTAEWYYARQWQPTRNALNKNSCHSEANEKINLHNSLPRPPAYCPGGAMVTLCGSFGCWTGDFSTQIKRELAIGYWYLCQVCHKQHISAFRRHTEQLGLRGERNREQILTMLQFCTECN